LNAIHQLIYPCKEEWRDETVHTARGTITRVYCSGHNDFPEFEMKTDDGKILTWARNVNRFKDGRYYREGARIEVDYVIVLVDRDAVPDRFTKRLDFGAYGCRSGVEYPVEIAIRVEK